MMVRLITRLIGHDCCGGRFIDSETIKDGIETKLLEPYMQKLYTAGAVSVKQIGDNYIELVVEYDKPRRETND